MFESLFSFGSLLAITISLTLTIKSLKISNLNAKRINSPDVIGDNNQIIINQLASKGVEDFKQLSNIIIFLLLVSFPFFPDFFIKFLSTFSLCSVLLCIAGVCKNIQQRNANSFYGLSYIVITAFIGVLSINAIYVALSGKYIFIDFYSRLLVKAQSFHIDIDYLNGLKAILGEGMAYVGFSLLFASLIHACFGFLRCRNFDETCNFVKFWVPLSLVGHFLASGCLIAMLNENFQYIVYIYKNLLTNFFVYIS